VPYRKSLFVDQDTDPRVGMLVCFCLSMTVFCVALVVLPLSRILPARLEQIGKTVDPRGDHSARALTVAPSATPGGIDALATATPTPAPVLTVAAAADRSVGAFSPAAPREEIPASAFPPAEPTPRIHVIEAGDTLYGVARRYHVAAQSLAAVNGIPPSGLVKVGQQLQIP